METKHRASEDISPPEIHAQKETGELRKRNRKRRILLFIGVSILNAGLLVLLGSELLNPAQDQLIWGALKASAARLMGTLHQTLPYLCLALVLYPQCAWQVSKGNQ